MGWLRRPGRRARSGTWFQVTALNAASSARNRVACYFKMSFVHRSSFRSNDTAPHALRRCRRRAQMTSQTARTIAAKSRSRTRLNLRRVAPQDSSALVDKRRLRGCSPCRDKPPSALRLDSCRQNAAVRRWVDVCSQRRSKSRQARVGKTGHGSPSMTERATMPDVVLRIGRCDTKELSLLHELRFDQDRHVIGFQRNPLTHAEI